MELIAFVFVLSMLAFVAAVFVLLLRRPLSAASIILSAAFIVVSAYVFRDGYGAVLVLVGVFQIINIVRLLRSHMHERYLRAVCLRTGIWISSMVGFATYSHWVISILQPSFHSYVIVLSVVQLAASLVCAASLIYHLNQSRSSRPAKYFSDHELPTVSVLIPARNETTDLDECLRSIVASDYPKLEVLVLDDCSAGKHIPEIVKQFAHDGVRFINGDMPNVNWLAKNQAYQTLADASSGELLLFIGVDVRLSPSAIRALVTQAINNKTDMISVLPTRTNVSSWSGVLSPLRYFWQLCLPRIPVLSTLWLIQRRCFYDLGGMAAVERRVVPEQYFARELSKQGSYAFLATNADISVETSKNIAEQRATSIRTQYPSVHRRPEIVLIQNLVIAIILLGSLPVGIYAASQNIMAVALMAGSAWAILTICHVLITIRTNPIIWPLSIFSLAPLLIQELVIINLSMYRYEFSEVLWKGRNICLPVMHAMPSLPTEDRRSK